MWRQEGRFNEMVNGYFICDRGRYGFAYESHPERPRRARIAGAEVDWPEAMAAAAAETQPDRRDLRPRGRRLPGLGPQQPGDPGDAASAFAGRLGWPEPRYFTVPSQERKVKAAVSRLEAPPGRVPAGD